MNAREIIDTARTLVASDKGLLVMDDSNSTCNKRFAKLGIPQTEVARRTYRELIVAPRKKRWTRWPTPRCSVSCELYLLPFRVLRSCRAANQANWPRPV
jgi:Fructose-bisphosphate aldolase class-I